MSQLAMQQRALVNALFAADDGATEKIASYLMDTWGRGLKTYKANAQALAQRALGAAYPVVASLLGDESFAALASALWHAHPPVRGDMAQWGDALAGYVQDSRQLADEPYLADVARVEWAMHCCETLADRTPDPATFQYLMTADPDDLGLVLAPGSQASCRQWPVASIVTAHLDGGPTLEVAGRRLGDRIAEDAIVWRMGHQPRVREALPGEAAFIGALLEGCPLGAALLKTDALDFNAWLPMAAQTGLLLAVQPAGPTQPHTLTESPPT